MDKGLGPFPNFARPFPTEAEKAVRLLSELHGTKAASSAGTASCGRVVSVLDSLVRTILSQNTTDKTSMIAFESLKDRFKLWIEVLQAEDAVLEEAIRFGGLAEIKANRIKALLNALNTKYRKQSWDGHDLHLEWLHKLQSDQIKDFLSQFKGVGPKTISCVLMFALQRADFPVDTHVWHIAKRLQWAPQSCSRESCYEHLNSRIPDHCKYSLHVLLVQHGKECSSCSKRGQSAQKAPPTPPDTKKNALKCPFQNWGKSVAIELQSGLEDDYKPSKTGQSENNEHVTPAITVKIEGVVKPRKSKSHPTAATAVTAATSATAMTEKVDASVIKSESLLNVKAEPGHHIGSTHIGFSANIGAADAISISCSRKRRRHCI